MSAGRRDYSEQTPLLRHSSSSSFSSRHSLYSDEDTEKKKALQTYGLTLGFLAILSLLVYTVRSSLPTPLSDTAAVEVDGFPGVHAYEAYLSQFTEPHPINSRANIAMKKWLDEIALDLQAEGAENGVEVDVITNDTTVVDNVNDWFGSNEHWIARSRNLIVRVRGSSGSEDAVLLNAHYDSVPTSYGVTDDGIGIAVEMELLRYFVRNPPRTSIIFLFNNFEEGGLVGARQFTKHPWFKTVKLFINLEGAGAGGRALLFRCSSLPAAKLLASNSPLVHATPLGNDMFKLGLLKSDTDYSILEAAGVPGMDIAFYAPRSHYHTPRDRLEYTPAPAESVQHMGQMVLATVQAIDRTDDFFDEEPETKLLYYDVLGKIMFAYDFVTHGTSNFLALFFTPAWAIAWTLISSDKNVGHLKKRVGVLVQGAIATLVGFVFTVMFVGIASAGLLNLNPMVTYGNIMAVAFYLFLAGLLGVITSQLLCSKFASMRNTLSSSIEASLYGLTAFWWFMLIASSYAGAKQVAILYFVMFSFVGNAGACFLYHAITPGSRLRMPLAFLVQVGLPFTVMIDQSFLVMDSMRHATVDGTPEAAVFGLVAFPIVLMALQLQPWVNAAGQKGYATLVVLTTLVLTFAVCSVLQPFNSGWSPNKIKFGQEYNATSGLATVSMIAASGIPSALHQILPANESKTIRCESYKTYQTRCMYETNLVPIYADQPDELVITVKDKHCENKTGLCQIQVESVAQNSLLCRVRFDGNNDSITKAWAHGFETEKDKPIGALLTYTLEYGQPIQWGVEYSQSPLNRSLVAVVGCFYDEWTQGQIPAFTYLHENLDDSITLLLRGQGLSMVYYKTLEL
ncbi:hypothetical protein BDB00DRAFT_765537 [Zychaea mexicana]|uniref:uncharacterized protein n=1 Tax=Zychaea mexicana TaxID=64656 RepID=UPI0022FEF729|nr:uncharacterized protein BDB00DRAFT_765537 [Zychaea mexicana]KAI9492346.1 hypothetical protein BDB00DRAFT_765537 [Zychaea mexicana]